MITSFSVKNFRCLRDLAVDSLGRVNILMGRNNTGKTTFLEALFLHAGPNSPDISYRLNTWRRYPIMSANAREMWGWLFFEGRIDSTIETVSREADGRELRVSVAVEESTVVDVKPSRDGDNGDDLARGSRPLGLGSLVVTWPDGEGGTRQGKVTVRAEGMRLEGVHSEPLMPGVFISRAVWPPERDVERFSKLERSRRHDAVKRAMAAVEPRLTNVVVGVVEGMKVLFCDIGAAELLPMQMMGDGTNWVASVVLGIAEAPGGIVLIDEVDSGLHHTVQKDFWKAIAEAARGSDAQIFAATHNLECVEKAHEAFQETGTYDLRVHRLDLEPDGSHRVATFDETKLSTALEQGWEVR